MCTSATLTQYQAMQDPNSIPTQQLQHKFQYEKQIWGEKERIKSNGNGNGEKIKHKY